jgi:hypothetical protein
MTAATEMAEAPEMAGAAEAPEPLETAAALEVAATAVVAAAVSRLVRGSIRRNRGVLWYASSSIKTVPS